MSKIFKLSDLQKTIDITSILNIQPLSSNYCINNNNIIVEVNKFYKHSVLPLMDHLRLSNVNDSCYVKISDTDVAIIDKFYP